MIILNFVIITQWNQNYYFTVFQPIFPKKAIKYNN